MTSIKCYPRTASYLITILSSLFFLISCQQRTKQDEPTEALAAFKVRLQVIDTGQVLNPWAKMIGDVDGDGSKDVIIGGQNGPLVWFRNPDWDLFKIVDGGYSTVDGEAGDIDQDGDIDLVMGGLFWYENPGDLAEDPNKTWTTHQIAEHPTHDVELADINNDGFMDVVTRNQSDFGTLKGNTIHIWTNNPGEDWTQEILECDHGEGLRVADLDNDGDTDVVGTGFWFENRAGESWERHDFAQWHASSNLAVGDINGDSRPDVVLTPSELAEQYYRISWFEQPDNVFSDQWTEHSLVDTVECVIHGVEVGDFNQDGALDISYSEMHQGQDPDEVVVLINLGSGQGWDRTVLSTKGSHSIQVDDIDGDGSPDILGANWSGDYQPIELWITEKVPVL